MSAFRGKPEVVVAGADFRMTRLRHWLCTAAMIWLWLALSKSSFGRSSRADRGGCALRFKVEAHDEDEGWRWHPSARNIVQRRADVFNRDHLLRNAAWDCLTNIMVAVTVAIGALCFDRDN